MSTASIKMVREIILILSEEEACYLKALLQNAIHPSDDSREDPVDSVYRESIFVSLQQIL